MDKHVYQKFLFNLFHRVLQLLLFSHTCWYNIICCSLRFYCLYSIRNRILDLIRSIPKETSFLVSVSPIMSYSLFITFTGGKSRSLYQFCKPYFESSCVQIVHFVFGPLGRKSGVVLSNKGKHQILLLTMTFGKTVFIRNTDSPALHYFFTSLLRFNTLL